MITPKCFPASACTFLVLSTSTPCQLFRSDQTNLQTTSGTGTSSSFGSLVRSSRATSLLFEPCWTGTVKLPIAHIYNSSPPGNQNSDSRWLRRLKILYTTTRVFIHAEAELAVLQLWLTQPSDAFRGSAVFCGYWHSPSTIALETKWKRQKREESNNIHCTG